MAKISDFLKELASKPQLAASFDKKPVATMKKKGLTVDQMELILEGTIDQLRTAIANELNVAKVDVFMVKMRP